MFESDPLSRLTEKFRLYKALSFLSKKEVKETIWKLDGKSGLSSEDLKLALNQSNKVKPRGQENSTDEPAMLALPTAAGNALFSSDLTQGLELLIRTPPEKALSSEDTNKPSEQKDHPAKNELTPIAVLSNLVNEDSQLTDPRQLTTMSEQDIQSALDTVEASLHNPMPFTLSDLVTQGANNAYASLSDNKISAKMGKKPGVQGEQATLSAKSDYDLFDLNNISSPYFRLRQKLAFQDVSALGGRETVSDKEQQAINATWQKIKPAIEPKVKDWVNSHHTIINQLPKSLNDPSPGTTGTPNGNQGKDSSKIKASAEKSTVSIDENGQDKGTHTQNALAGIIRSIVMTEELQNYINNGDDKQKPISEALLDRGQEQLDIARATLDGFASFEAFKPVYEQLNKRLTLAGNQLSLIQEQLKKSDKVRQKNEKGMAQAAEQKNSLAKTMAQHASQLSQLSSASGSSPLSTHNSLLDFVAEGAKEAAQSNWKKV